MHQNLKSKKMVRLPFGEKCYECTQRPFHETSLGQLPAEIRNQIYQMVLTISSHEMENGVSVGISKQGTANQLHEGKVVPPSILSILQTCRQAYAETYHIFYANNTLHFNNAQDLLGFLVSIGPKRYNEISSLHLEGMMTRIPYQDLYPESSVSIDIDHEYLEDFLVVRVQDDAYKAAGLLNGTGNLRKLYLETDEDQIFEWRDFCHSLWGLDRRDEYFDSPYHWSILPGNMDFLGDLATLMERPIELCNESFRVTVDIWPSSEDQNQRGRVRYRNTDPQDLEAHTISNNIHTTLDRHCTKRDATCSRSRNDKPLDAKHALDHEYRPSSETESTSAIDPKQDLDSDISSTISGLHINRTSSNDSDEGDLNTEKESTVHAGEDATSNNANSNSINTIRKSRSNSNVEVADHINAPNKHRHSNRRHHRIQRLAESRTAIEQQEYVYDKIASGSNGYWDIPERSDDDEGSELNPDEEAAFTIDDDSIWWDSD